MKKKFFAIVLVFILSFGDYAFAANKIIGFSAADMMGGVEVIPTKKVVYKVNGKTRYITEKEIDECSYKVNNRIHANSQLNVKEAIEACEFVRERILNAKESVEIWYGYLKIDGKVVIKNVDTYTAGWDGLLLRSQCRSYVMTYWSQEL